MKHNLVVIVTAYDLTRVSLTGQTDAGTSPTPLGSGQTNEVGLHANREAEIPENFAKTVAVVIAAVIATSSHLPPHCRLASIAVVVAPDPRLSAVLLGPPALGPGALAARRRRRSARIGSLLHFPPHHDRGVGTHG